MDDLETAALAALDDRARRAASSLRAAVAEARDWTSLDLQTPPGELSGNGVVSIEHEGHDIDASPDSGEFDGASGTRPPWRIRGDHEEPEGRPADKGTEVVLQGRDEDGEAWTTRVTTGDRRRWLAAAAVFVVVIAVGGFLALRDGGGPTLQAAQPGPSEYLVAGWLPEGWEPLHAALNPRHGVGVVADGETAAYGSTTREDPWTGPVLAAQRYTVDPDDWWTPAPKDVTNITIEGVPVFVEDNGDVIRVGAAEPIGGDQYLAVVGYGFELDVVLEAAEQLTTDPAVGHAGLPDSYEEIARGPAGLVAGMPYGSFDGLEVSYGPPADDSPQIRLGQQPADSPGAAALIRLVPLEAGSDFEVDIAQVRGQEAYVLRVSHTNMTEGVAGTDAAAETSMGQSDDAEIADGDTGEASMGDDPTPTEIATATTIVQWYEPSLKMVVGLTAFDVDEETLDRFIESLHVASPQEIAGLLDRYPEEPPWLDGGDVASGDESGRGAPVAIAEGEEAGQRWQLLVYEQDDGYAEIELNWADAMSGLSLPAEDRWQATTVGPLVGEGDRDIGVFGLVSEDAARVTVGLPGGDEHTMDIHEIDGLDMQAFVGFVPFTQGSVEVVVRDADGRLLPGWPQTIPIDELD